MYLIEKPVFFVAEYVTVGFLAKRIQKQRDRFMGENKIVQKKNDSIANHVSYSGTLDDY